ncbi:MAG: hypothetical protein S4CHLAM81_14400 [Chlamydiales bacterium]|nr:hypothetical protein [Chlamydiales bacterium]MCH9636212.1 hypothetical protein [Chlamydiales bacterium]MCH9703802.1 lipid-A-disaccharide synthase N-terminal domain-containing protein [Chlamydiota bacterium]
MIENWRQLSYFLLGALPPLLFGSRSIVQWIQSEREKRSVVGRLFWRLSITGNLLLALHYFIQFQYPFFLIQIANSFIAWRNLNFLQKQGTALRFRKAIWILCLSLALAVVLCFIQTILSSVDTSVLSPPVGRIIQREQKVHLLWHIFGLFGGVLFASRFWIQWIEAERSHASQLGFYFWLTSLFGSVCSLLYFLYILDWVSAAHHSFGMIPYMRNILLLRSEKRALN